MLKKKRSIAVFLVISLFIMLMIPQTATGDTVTPPVGSQIKLFLRTTAGASDFKGTLSFSAGTTPASDSVRSAGSSDHFDIPTNKTMYEISGISATYDQLKTTNVEFYVDAGSNPGNGLQARISYDFDGNGRYDAWQVYDMFATDPVASTWELYGSSTRQVKFTYGTMKNLVKGKIKVELWNAIGSTGTFVRTDAPNLQSQSSIQLPFTFNAYNPPSASPSVGPTATPLAPIPEPTALPNENISSNWQNELGAGSISSNPGINPNWDENDLPSNIYKTGNITGAVSTNDWVSSVVWLPFSEPLYADPLAFKCVSAGFEVSKPPKQYYKDADGDIEVAMRLDDNFPSTIDFTVQPDNFTPVDARADKLSDWAADILMANGSKNMKATIAHGSPYAYFTFTGAKPKIVFKKAPTDIFYGKDGTSQVIGIDLNGKYYGFFAPVGSTWSGLGTDTIICNFPTGKNYLSLAILPDKSALDFYRNYAYAFITDTSVKWGYNPVDSSVATTFKATTTAMEGTNTDTIFALYPHQWRDNKYISILPYSYSTIRGTMKTVAGKMFQTKYQYNGILPNLPGTITSDTAIKAKLQQFVDDVEKDTLLHNGIATDTSGYDTYWMGKGMGKLSNILPIAEQVGDTTAANTFANALKSKLQDFFKADPSETTFYDNNEANNIFYYNKNWGTLIGYDASYGIQNELNDHHFHYGYFIYAAAQIAMRDPNWASDTQWGPMVKLLIKDIANYNKADTRFPFLRNFDPYAGHSWASGHAKFVDGNNQESSSEAINAWAGLILWGEATGNTTIRDLGIYLYTTETMAINNYWFDIYGDVHDEEYVNVDCSMIWGGKSVHATWWTNDPIQVHGINMLPMGPASLYLGTDPNYVKRNYDSIWTEWQNWLKIKPADQNSDPKLWQDILLQYYALYNPQEAISKWDENYTTEFGESKAHIYQWMQNLNSMGLPDFTVTANTPLYGVFNKNGLKTYVAYNASSSPIRVSFSDGKTLDVAAKSMKTSNENDPTTPPGYKLSGYVCPDFISSQDAAANIKSGFTVTLSGTNYTAQTDGNGYFEISNITNNTTGYTVVINKTNYLERAISNVIINKNTQLGTQSAPLGIWAGDNVKDNVINMADVMELAKVYNSVSGDGKYQGDADFNKDSAINMADIMIMVRHFNKMPQDYPGI